MHRRNIQTTKKYYISIVVYKDLLNSNILNSLVVVAFYVISESPRYYIKKDINEKVFDLLRVTASSLRGIGRNDTT